MKRREKEYYVEILEKETNCLAELMGELHNKSKRLWSLMNFFYEYGFKKINVTPEERTLRSKVDSFNKNRVNKYEEINVTIEDMQFLLETVRQMCRIRGIINEIENTGYYVEIARNKWYFAGIYFY